MNIDKMQAVQRQLEGTLAKVREERAKVSNEIAKLQDTWKALNTQFNYSNGQVSLIKELVKQEMAEINAANAVALSKQPGPAREQAIAFTGCAAQPGNKQNEGENNE